MFIICIICKLFYTLILPCLCINKVTTLLCIGCFLRPCALRLGGRRENGGIKPHMQPHRSSSHLLAYGDALEMSLRLRHEAERHNQRFFKYEGGLMRYCPLLEQHELSDFCGMYMDLWDTKSVSLKCFP